jgi:hypothetical protein
MPNWKLPIQRANSTCEPKASRALTTRIKNTVPARRCTRTCSAPSTRDLMRDRIAGGDSRGRWDAYSEPVRAKRASAGTRPLSAADLEEP